VVKANILYSNAIVKTPVVFIIFNRPDTTAKVFASIRQAQPPKLLVIADGPRPDRLGEAQKCHETREIIKQVDWDCEVLTNYADTNLGCRDRVSSGLDWVFDRVEAAIILEDDCLPDPSFFPFCEEMLEKYRDDERIVVVAGSNFQFGRKRTEYSYYYSRYNHCWGWASWKRSWQNYDRNMIAWEEIREGNWLNAMLDDARSVNCWRKIFQDTYDKKNNSWAYRWTFSCWIQSGLTVLPHVNLVANIGFGHDATHTKKSTNKLSNMPTADIGFPLKHPPFVIRDRLADRFTQENIFATPRIVQRILKKINVFTK
jgi:hypothetical protein